jgi:anti-sigma B factor antagonist
MSGAVKLESDYAVVSLEGDFDLHSSVDARRLILGCLQNSKPTLVDLNHVGYIDSAGVASLVEGFHLARQRKLDFGLVVGNNNVLEVLKLARLDKVFSIYPNVQARLLTK